MLMLSQPHITGCLMTEHGRELWNDDVQLSILRCTKVLSAMLLRRAGNLSSAKKVDWQCSCGCNNFAKRTSCYRCTKILKQQQNILFQLFV